MGDHIAGGSYPSTLFYAQNRQRTGKRGKKTIKDCTFVLNCANFFSYFNITLYFCQAKTMLI